MTKVEFGRTGIRTGVYRTQ